MENERRGQTQPLSAVGVGPKKSDAISDEKMLDENECAPTENSGLSS